MRHRPTDEAKRNSPWRLEADSLDRGRFQPVGNRGVVGGQDQIASTFEHFKLVAHCPGCPAIGGGDHLEDGGTGRSDPHLLRAQEPHAPPDAEIQRERPSDSEDVEHRGTNESAKGQGQPHGIEATYIRDRGSR